MGCFHHFSLRQTGNHFHISTLDVEDAKNTFSESGGGDYFCGGGGPGGISRDEKRVPFSIDGRMAIFRSPFRVHLPSPASQKEAKSSWKKRIKKRVLSV